MSERPKFIERLMARREQHRERHIAFRVVWGIAGTVVLTGGVIMLVTPGPGGAPGIPSGMPGPIPGPPQNALPMGPR